jgi:bis(5'-nucleosyl)-tetraphosphatase (symmetrical)
LATYAIGDLQGCFAPLERLVEAIAFDPSRDRLWFVGDLVNRGPDSARCLRFVKALGEAAVSVLGNHDLHLLCVAEGIHRTGKRDTLESVLADPDRAELLEWLRHRPLMHADRGHVLVHAGILPAWSVSQARALAGEVEGHLRGPRYREFLENMFGDEPVAWREDLRGWDRVRIVVNAMTRMRMCAPDGTLALGYKGEPDEDAPEGLVPWYDVPGRLAAGEATIFFGHWSALGLKVRNDIVGLDSGCVWGRSLSAIRLEDRSVFEVPCSMPPRG